MARFFGRTPRIHGGCHSGNLAKTTGLILPPISTYNIHMRACISIMRAVCSYAYAIAASIAAFSGGVSCQRDHAGAVDIDAGRVCLAAPPACCLENAPFESRCLTPSPLASPGGHMGGHAGGSVMCHVPRHGRRRARDGAAAR